jgi:hypothetical protein
MRVNSYKSATILLQFGNIFPTPERHTSFRRKNMMYVLEGISYTFLGRETHGYITAREQHEFGHNERTNGMESRAIASY